MVTEKSGRVNLLTGLLLVAITGLVIFHEWHIAAWMAPAKPVLVVGLTAILATQVRVSRKAFVAVALGLTLALASSVPGWQGTALDGLRSAAFIAAFFSALSTLRNVAQTSPAVQAAGRFLSGQPPGRRYAALTSAGRVSRFCSITGPSSFWGRWRWPMPGPSPMPKSAATVSGACFWRSSGPSCRPCHGRRYRLPWRSRSASCRGQAGRR